MTLINLVRGMSSGLAELLAQKGGGNCQASKVKLQGKWSSLQQSFIVRIYAVRGHHTF